MRILSLLQSVLVIALAVVVGCSEPKAAGVPQQYRPQGMVAAFDQHDWQTVLQKVVTPDGYVHWDLFQKNSAGVRDALYRYVALIGTVSPDNRPDLFQT